MGRLSAKPGGTRVAQDRARAEHPGRRPGRARVGQRADRDTDRRGDGQRGWQAVAAVLTPDAKFWHPVVPLGYGRTYTLTITSRGPGGKTATQQSSFSTLTPPNQTKVSFQTTSEAALADGATYGVGVIIVAHFDEPITDKAEAERRLVVTGSPPVSGSWNWVDDQNAHWRPEHYYAPATTVTIDAKVY